MNIEIKYLTIVTHRHDQNIHSFFAFTALLQLNGSFGKEVHSTSEASKQVCFICSSNFYYSFQTQG